MPKVPKLGTKIDSHYDINVDESTIGVNLLGVLLAGSVVAVLLLLAIVLFVGFKYNKLKDIKEDQYEHDEAVASIGINSPRYSPYPSKKKSKKEYAVQLDQY